MKLGINEANMTPSPQGLQAYDGTHKIVMGTIIINVEVGGLETSLAFQVIDIDTTFNLLLCCPLAT